MSTFYVLPPRAILADRLSDALAGLLPGLALDSATRARLADVVLDVVAEQDDVFLVGRDELPAGAAPERALIDGYGATVDDEVIEVRPAARAGDFTTRRWRIAG